MYNSFKWKCYTQQYVIVTRSMGKTGLNLALKLYYHPGIRITGVRITGVRITGVRITEGPMYLRTTKCNNQCEIYTQDAVPYKRTLIQAKSLLI
jgi:hypothetical protein